MANTIRIKRSTGSSAPGSLANAELAYAEGSNVLYYGTGTGGAGGTATSIEAIGGDGYYSTLTTAQTISGNKTYTGTLDFSGATVQSFTCAQNLVVSGNLTVSGTTTTVSSTTVTVADKNLELAKGAANDAAADGGGLTLDSGDGDKTWNWVNSTDAWTSSEHIDLASGKGLKIAGTTVLDASGYTGNAATATRGDTVAISNDTSNNARYLTFTTGYSASGLALSVDGSAHLTFNPSTNVLEAGSFTGSGASLTNLDASALASGTVATARLGSGSASQYNFLRGDGSWQEVMTPAGGSFTSGADVKFQGSGSNKDLEWDASAYSLIFWDDVKAVFGTSSDGLEIFHNASDSVINDNGTGSLKLQLGGSTKAEVVSGGFTVTGTATATTFSGSGASLTSLPAGNLTGTVATARLGTGTASSSNFLRGDGSWQTVTSTTINNNANNRLITGSSTANTLEAEANLTFNPGTGILAAPVVTLSQNLKTSARVKVNTGATAQYETIDFDTNGETNYMYQGSHRLQLKSSGVTFYGDEFEVNGDLELKGATTGRNVVWDKSDDALEFADNAKLVFGAGGDLEIKHDSSAAENLILSKNKNLFIKSGNADEAGIRIYTDGKIDLSFNGQPKIETSNTGATISGTCTATSGFSGSGANLTSLPAGQLTGSLPAISGANLTNVNATTLDSIDSGSFLRSDATDTMSATLTIDSGSAGDTLNLKNNSSPMINFKVGNTQKGYLSFIGGRMQLANEQEGCFMKFEDDWTFSNDSGSNFYSVIHQGNVGSGGKLSNKNVYVNQIHGDGSNLTNLPASEPSYAGLLKHFCGC